MAEAESEGDGRCWIVRENPVATICTVPARRVALLRVSLFQSNTIHGRLASARVGNTGRGRGPKGPFRVMDGSNIYHRPRNLRCV